MAFFLNYYFNICLDGIILSFQVVPAQKILVSKEGAAACYSLVRKTPFEAWFLNDGNRLPAGNGINFREKKEPG